MLIDPEYGGFKPLADDHNLPVSTLITGRRLYYTEGEKIPHLYLKHVRSKFVEYQNDAEDTRSTLRQGGWFVFATILLDWLVCSV